MFNAALLTRPDHLSGVNLLVFLIPHSQVWRDFAGSVGDSVSMGTLRVWQDCAGSVGDFASVAELCREPGFPTPHSPPHSPLPTPHSGGAEGC